MPSRLAPRAAVIRALFARSGNRCAFPQCQSHLVNIKNQFVGHICHINAALPGGQRFDAAQSEEERRSYDNLLLMCYPHHVETNSAQEFSAESLRNIKIAHEARFTERDYEASDDLIATIIADSDRYWDNVERLNTVQHTMREFAVTIDSAADFEGVLNACRGLVAKLTDFCAHFQESDDRLLTDFESLVRRKNIDVATFQDIPYYENPFHARNWEFHNLAIPNVLQELDLLLRQLELRHVETALQTDPGSVAIRSRLEALRSDFASLAQNVVGRD